MKRDEESGFLACLKDAGDDMKDRLSQKPKGVYKQRAIVEEAQT